MLGMVTLRDIALRAGVSTATVSNVLNSTLYVSPKLRERVLTAVRELKYQPNAVARSLRMRQSRTIGMIIPDIANPFFPAVVRGAEDVLMHSGYTLIVGNSDNDQAKEEAYYRAFFERQVDGLLAVATTGQPPDGLKRLNDRNTPIVFVDRYYLGIPGDVVIANNQAGARKAVAHFAERGHKRIAIITGPLDLVNARARLDGYRQELQSRGLEVNKELIREGAFDTASGVEQTAALLALKPRPDAIFVCNALMVCGALQCLEKEKVKCPKDVAVACFDRLDFFDLLRPQLTCVAAPSYELGATGAELVLKRITGKLTGPWQRRVLPTPLVERESSG
jgi:LacI family transcriptional regulator